MTRNTNNSNTNRTENQRHLGISQPTSREKAACTCLARHWRQKRARPGHFVESLKSRLVRVRGIPALQSRHARNLVSPQNIAGVGHAQRAK